MIIPSLYTLLWVYGNIFPSAWYNHVYKDAGEKCTILISNIPTFLTKVTYCGGYPLKKFISSTTGTGNMATTLNVFTLHKRVSITLTSDTSQIEDVDGFIAYVNQRINELTIAYDSEEEGHD